VFCCLPGLQRIGLKALRVWGFNSAFPSAPGQYSDQQGQGLDYVIAGAAKRGLRVELALANFWNGELCVSSLPLFLCSALFSYKVQRLYY
jgi:hypothetical protein